MVDSNSPENDRRDAETNRIAAEGNRMTAEDARVVVDTARSTSAEARRARRKRLNLAQIGAYALIVLVAMVGFYRIESAVARNTVLTTCLTEWVMKNTTALRDRDALNITARDAEQEMWQRIQRYLAQGSRTPRQRPVVAAIRDYRDVVTRLSRQESINPYPDISTCLSPMAVAQFRLMSSATGRPCFGRQVTIRGTRGPDVIHGTDGPDVIGGWTGNDLIFAGGGNDLICGRRGDDTLNGGLNFDRGHGGRGGDVCVQVERSRSCG